MKTNYWKDAPDWAKLLVWDSEGCAFYYGVATWCMSLINTKEWAECPQYDDIDKASQLEKRPEEL